MRIKYNSSINFFIISALYAGLFILIFAAEKSKYFVIKLLVIPLIAALQNHLQILQHEGAHYLLHPNRAINDFVTNLFCTIPFFGLISHYRYFHFLHHKHLLNEKLDPELKFYQEQGHEISWKDICGINFFQFFYSYNRYLWNHRNKIKANNLKSELWQIVVVALMFSQISCEIIMLYWFIPQMTFLFLFMKIHGLSEHTNRTGSVSTCTINTKRNWIGKFFISPLNSNLHLSHHLIPGAPWYQLKSQPTKKKIIKNNFISH